MKKFILLFALVPILLQFGCNTENPVSTDLTIKWERVLNLAGNDLRPIQIFDTELGYILFCTNNDAATSELLMILLDGNGKESHKTSFLYADALPSWSIAKTKNNDFVVCGLLKNKNPFILKIDQYGNLYFKREYSWLNNYTITSVVGTDDQGFMIAANETKESTQQNKIILMDSTGNIHFVNTLSITLYSFIYSLQSFGYGTYGIPYVKTGTTTGGTPGMYIIGNGLTVSSHTDYFNHPQTGILYLSSTQRPDNIDPLLFGVKTKAYTSTLDGTSIIDSTKAVNWIAEVSRTGKKIWEMEFGITDNLNQTNLSFYSIVGGVSTRSEHCLISRLGIFITDNNFSSRCTILNNSGEMIQQQTYTGYTFMSIAKGVNSGYIITGLKDRKVIILRI